MASADIDQETAIILAQLAYLDQKKGNLESAKKLYEEVLSKKVLSYFTLLIRLARGRYSESGLSE